jgi:glutamate-1-semialdehyde aminotransferase
LLHASGGQQVFDLDGNESLDYAFDGMGPNILGHGPKRVLEAISEVLCESRLCNRPAPD